MNAAQMLEVHREVWDMPSLAEYHPEILKHLDSRYEVHFGMMSDVIVIHKEGREIEHFSTTDVREAVALLLEAEALAEEKAVV